MSVLEIEAPARLRPAADPAREVTVAVTPAVLGLSSRPDFLSAGASATVAPDRPTLWDALRLSWADPQIIRHLTGRHLTGRDLTGRDLAAHNLVGG